MTQQQREAHNYHGANPAKLHLPGNKTHRGTAAYEAGDERHRTKAGVVCIENGRRYVGIEISPEYIGMSLRRLAKTQPQLVGLAL